MERMRKNGRRKRRSNLGPFRGLGWALPPTKRLWETCQTTRLGHACLLLNDRHDSWHCQSSEYKIPPCLESVLVQRPKIEAPLLLCQECGPGRLQSMPGYTLAGGFICYFQPYLEMMIWIYNWLDILGCVIATNQCIMMYHVQIAYAIRTKMVRFSHTQILKVNHWWDRWGCFV